MSPQESGIIANTRTSPDYGEKPNSRRAAAIKRARQLSVKIIQDNPNEVVDMFREQPPRPYIDIARELLPETASTHPGVAGAAVRFALSALLPQEERDSISRRRRETYLTKVMEDLGPKGYRQHQVDAAKARNLKHGAYTKGIVEGRGFVPWSEKETETLLSKLLGNPKFQHRGDRSKDGSPDFKKIADVLNATFHKSKHVRNRRSLRAYVVWSKKQNQPERDQEQAILDFFDAANPNQTPDFLSAEGLEEALKPQE